MNIVRKTRRFIAAGLAALAALAGVSLAHAAAEVNVVAVEFIPATIRLGATSTLRVELRNNGAGGQRASIDYPLLVPEGLTVQGHQLGQDCNAAAVAFLTEGSLSGVTLIGLTLLPSGTCTVDVNVSASGIDTFTFVADGPGSTLVSASLTVTEPPEADAVAINVSQSVVPFPPQEVGIPSAPRFVTVTNAGAPTVTISGILGSGPFATSHECDSVTLPSGAACTFSIVFTPPSTGPAEGSVQISSNAPLATSIVLYGDGIAPLPVLSSPSFGSIPVSSSVTRDVTLTNTTSATAALTIANITVSGAFFSGSHDCPAFLGVGDSCIIAVTYAPTATGEHSGQLKVWSNTEGNSLVVTLSGTATPISSPGAPAMQLSSSGLAFELTFLNTVSRPRTVTVTNGGTGPMQISSITTIGDFGYSGCGFPSTIAPGASCMLSITFKPLSGGPLEGSIQVVSDAPGSPHSIALSGTGALVLNPVVSLAPAALDFGTLRVGSDAVSTMRLTNVGNMALTISAISSAGSMFSQTNDCPALLPAAAFCDIEVTYAPTSAGAHHGQVRILSNATPSEHIAALSGTGIPLPPAFMVVDTLVDFGQQLTESVTRAALAISNTGGQPLVISRMQLSGAPEFGIEGNCAVIEPKDTCSLTVLFAPAAEGVSGGRIEIVSNHFGGMVTVDLVGQGIARPRADLELLVEGLGFGNQVVGSVSDTRPVGVTNVGNLPLQFLGFDLPLDFNVDSRQCPAQLMPGQSCELLVTFKPVVPGPRAGHLSIVSNAIGAPHSVSLTGTGCRFFTMRAARNPQRLCAP